MTSGKVSCPSSRRANWLSSLLPMSLSTKMKSMRKMMRSSIKQVTVASAEEGSAPARACALLALRFALPAPSLALVAPTLHLLPCFPFPSLIRGTPQRRLPMKPPAWGGTGDKERSELVGCGLHCRLLPVQPMASKVDPSLCSYFRCEVMPSTHVARLSRALRDEVALALAATKLRGFVACCSAATCVREHHKEKCLGLSMT